MQRARAAVEAAAGGELPERHAGDFRIARQNDASRGAAHGCQPRYHARHGKPRRDPLERRRHIDLEGSFLSARHERLLRLQWSPDSQFFVYSLVSSGGHSPWQFPVMVYGRKANAIARFSDMIDGKPTLSGDFNFTGPHTLTATTWKQPAAPGDKAVNDKVPITVDLEEAFKKLPSPE
jgi:hypothetical protein